MNIEEKVDKIYEQVTQLRIDVAKLKIKAGIWGALSGAIPVLLGLSIWIIKTLPF